MNKLPLLFGFLLLFSCSEEPSKENKDPENPTVDTAIVVDSAVVDTIEIKSDYTMDNVDPKVRQEFKANLAQIEKKHGVQWDFCTCVLANDSLNTAAQNPNLSDPEFDKIMERFDVVEEKCKAFRVQNPNQTPEERARHEKKVSDCLKEAKK